jgi:hypothetical protein
MRVAGAEPVGDGSAGLVDHDPLAPDRPLSGQGPVVEAQPLGDLIGAAFLEGGAVRCRELVAAPVAEVGLGRPQLLPVGFGLHTDPFDRDEPALDAEQLLDDALGLLIATLAEVLVDDDAVGVDQVQRRPVVVVEGAPAGVVVVDRDRVVDPSGLVARRTRSSWCSKENSGVWTPMTTNPSAR